MDEPGPNVTWQTYAPLERAAESPADLHGSLRAAGRALDDAMQSLRAARREVSVDDLFRTMGEIKVVVGKSGFVVELLGEELGQVEPGAAVAQVQAVTQHLRDASQDLHEVVLQLAAQLDGQRS